MQPQTIFSNFASYDNLFFSSVYTPPMKFRSLLSHLAAIILVSLITGCGDTIDSDTLSRLKTPSGALNSSSDYIAILGDLQTHSAFRYSTYLAIQVNWLKWQHGHTGNIKALLQTGDLSEQNLYSEWDFCRNHFSVLKGEIPVICCTGNHDYNWGNNQVIYSRNSTQFNDFMAESLPESIIVDRYEQGRVDNLVVKLDIHNKPLYIMALEFAPRPEIKEWADSIITATPERKYILMTHEFIWHWQRVSDGDSYALRQFPDRSGSTPEELWRTLVYPHDNVLAVLCGHNGYAEEIFSTNQAGREVPQIMFNLQYQQYDNIAHIMLWEFVNGSDKVNVRVYNPITEEFDSRDGTSFTMSLPL